MAVGLLVVFPFPFHIGCSLSFDFYYLSVLGIYPCFSLFKESASSFVRSLYFLYLNFGYYIYNLFSSIYIICCNFPKLFTIMLNSFVFSHLSFLIYSSIFFFNHSCSCTPKFRYVVFCFHSVQSIFFFLF